MKQEDFLHILAELLGTERPLRPEERLRDLAEWDSLGFVRFLQLAETQFCRSLSVSAVQGARSPGDLYRLVAP